MFNNTNEVHDLGFAFLRSKVNHRFYSLMHALPLQLLLVNMTTWSHGSDSGGSSIQAAGSTSDCGHWSLNLSTGEGDTMHLTSLPGQSSFLPLLQAPVATSSVSHLKSSPKWLATSHLKIDLWKLPILNEIKLYILLTPPASILRNVDATPC